MYFKKDVNAYQTSTMKNSHFFSTDETFVVLLLPAKWEFHEGNSYLWIFSTIFIKDMAHLSNDANDKNWPFCFP